MQATNFSVFVDFNDRDPATGRVQGETDDMSRTNVLVNGDAVIAPYLPNEYEFVLKNGDELMIDVPSGTLTGTVANLPAKLMLVNCQWQGSYGGLVGGQCALGGWELLDMDRAMVETSAAPGAVRWDLYKAAHSVASAAHIRDSLSSVRGAKKQKVMADFLTWFAANVEYGGDHAPETDYIFE